MNLITCFFSCLSFLTTLEGLEIIVLPAPSYNQHQQLFVEKLTDYPQVIGQKITVYKISPQLFLWQTINYDYQLSEAGEKKDWWLGFLL